MIIVRATQKLLNTQRLKPEIIDKSIVENVVLSEWYANTVTSSFRGKSLVMYVHQPSLITIVVVGKTIKKTFTEFTKRLQKLLIRFSFPASFINEQMAAFETSIITKTDSRKMLGFMNSITDQLISRMYSYENFEDIDLEEEENILMNYIHGSVRENYFKPVTYWGNYFLGEEPISNFSGMNNEKNSIQLIPDQNKLSRSEDLHMENQLMKLQIEDFLGGQIMGGNELVLPAEIENLFLKNILEFEKQSKNTKRVKIAELLGKQTFKPASEMNEKQLKTALDKAFALLDKNHIHLDFLAEYSNEIKYKFIAEELVNEEAQIMNMPGMIMHFIYEEFHPNSDFDIRNRIKHFLFTLFENEEGEENYQFSCKEEFRLNNEYIGLNELKEKANQLHLIHNVETIDDYKLKQILFNKENKKAKVLGNLEIKTEGSKIKTKIPITFFAENNNDWWELTGLDFEWFS
ncbi:MAG: DUF6933 domain-containing protein [Bacteroidia bacterium]